MDAGSYPVNPVGTPVITDENGSDVTEEFLVHLEPGTLQIQPRQVRLVSGSAEHAFNGRSISNNTVTVEGDGFAQGEGASYTFTASRSMVGISENVFTYELNNGTNAANYVITAEYGSLTIRNRDAAYEITVTANSGSFLYDGTEKTVEGLAATRFELEGVKYEVTGLTARASATDAGEYTVKVTGIPKIVDEKGNDVSSQFTVRSLDGKMTIMPRRVTIMSQTLSKPYDGTALYDSNVTVGGDGFAPSEGAFFISRSQLILPGSVDTVFEWILKQGTKEQNYIFTTQCGRLNVTPAEAEITVVLTPESVTVPENGEEQEVTGFTTTTFEVDGQTYTVEGVQTVTSGKEPGTYTSKIIGTPKVYDADGRDVTDQVAVVIENGTLTIEAQAPVEEIAEPTIPLAKAPAGYWALVNLILVIVTAFVMIYLFFVYVFVKKNKEDEEKQEEIEEEETEEERRKHIRLTWLSVIPVIGSALAFILTEDMSNTMRLLDKWTILMVVILLIQLALAYFCMKKGKEKEDDKLEKA